jgi:ABC-type sugar transport system substrate-binding protein
MRKSVGRRARPLMLFVAAALAIAACGSSASGAPSSAGRTGNATSGGDSPGVASAKALVAQYSRPQAPLSIPPVLRQPTAGLNFTFVGCTVPGCDESDITAAAQALRWHLNFIPYDVDSPQTFVAAFNQALQSSPAVFGYTGALPNDLVTSQLNEFASRHIPTATVASTSGLSDGVAGCYFCSPQFELDGKLMADIVAANAGSPQEIGYVTDPTLQKTSFAPVYQGFVSEIERTIPGSKIDIVDTSLDAPAAQNGSTVVSYVSSHPNVKYLVVAVAALTAGIPQALAQAGLAGKVKIVTRLLQTSNLAQVESGQIFASVASEDKTGNWRLIDALVRLSEGQKVYDPEPVGWHQIITKQNVSASMTLEPQGFPSAFLKAWHVR